jgi:hypothetical protein
VSGLSSWLLRETERNDRHSHVSVFVGPDADHRALAGRLVLDHDQAADLFTIMEYGYGGMRGRRRVEVELASSRLVE